MERETLKKWSKRGCYYVVWLVPLAVFTYGPVVSWLVKLGDLILPQPMAPLSTYILAAVVWSSLIFVSWVVIGDDSSVHRKNFKNYKSIWVSFVIVSLPLFLISFISFSGVDSRVKALRGTASMLSSLISNPKNGEAGIEKWINGGLNASRELNEKLMGAQTFEGIDGTKFERNLHGYARQSRQYAVLFYRMTQNLVQKQMTKTEGTESGENPLKPLFYIATEVDKTSQRIVETSAELIAAFKAARSGGLQEIRDLRTKGVELTNHYYQAQALISGAKNILAGTDVSLVAPFILVTVLYSVFLLFPWALLFLFLFRKQEYLVNEKAELLYKMGLQAEFMERNRRPGGSSDLSAVAEEVSTQAFRNCEYVVSLLLLTAINATMWYFFFYPHASAGLAQLISGGGSVKAFSDYIARDATPITFGFIGAYFFVIQMLLRRYFAGDLNPKAYMYAVVRLLTVFILGMIFQLATTHFGWTPVFAAVITFVIGIFPMSGLRWILRWANDLLKGLNAPQYVDRFPLTKLDGLNTWHEARLLEEKVENVQNLATASVDDLIIHTNFSPLQLVDWMDQALLFIHAEELWTDSFHGVGIRTATDLLDNTRKAGQGQFDPDTAGSLAAAMNAAQVLALPEPGHPREVTRLAAAKVYQSVADVAAMAKNVQGISEGLVGDKPETLDAIVGVQTKLKDLSGEVKRLKEERMKKMTEAVEKLPANAGDWVKRSKDAAGEAEKAATTLSGKMDAATAGAEKLDRKKPETLSRLKEVQEMANAGCVAAANLNAQVDKAVEMAEQGAAGTAETERDALLTILKEIRKAGAQVLKNSQEAREVADSLAKDRPETLNRVVALQANLTALYEAADKTRSRIKEAGKAVEGLQASQPLLTEARETLKASADLTNSLVTITTDLKDGGSALDIDAPATLSALPVVKETAQKALKAAEEAKAKGQAAAEVLQRASAPPQITREILRVMVSAIETGPNIKAIQRFWGERRVAA